VRIDKVLTKRNNAIVKVRPFELAQRKFFSGDMVDLVCAEVFQCITPENRGRCKDKWRYVYP
jgi:hypothetical protein